MSNSQPLLTICVPTYNRVRMLDKCLNALCKIQNAGVNFNVIVADNCSPDSTIKILSLWKEKFNNLKIIRQEENVGYDRNVLSLYEAIETKYFWLLSDCDSISEVDLMHLIEHCVNDYDAIIVNTEPNKYSTREVMYTNIDDFINQQGWHITKLSACVLNKKIHNPVLAKRYMGSNFIHVGHALECLSQVKSLKVFFDPSIHLIYLNDEGEYRSKVCWQYVPFNQWGRNWCNLVLSLPMRIPCELKLKVIKDHERQFHWFSIRNLLKNKIAYGKSYIENYKENRKFVRMVSVASPFWSDVVMYLPVEYLYRLLRPINNTCKYVWKGTKKYIKKVAKKFLRRGSK